MVIANRTKLSALADWIDGRLSETWADLLKIADRETRRAAYVAAGDLLFAQARQRGMTLSSPFPGIACLSAHDLTVEGPSALMLALLQTWRDEAHQLLLRDLIDA